MKNKMVVKEIYSTILDEIEIAGGKVFIVGGTVRDYLLNQEIDNQDMDVEVYGLTMVQLQNVLQQFGKVNEQGKSFGIVKLNEYPMIDFALPRIEKQIGVGHKEFEVQIDPALCYRKASKRRDFTINALMYDYHQGIIHDFYQGIKDMNKGCLRMVDKDTFEEDPLRVLRLAQFLSRFSFTVDEQTKKQCQYMVENHRLDTLSNSRKYEEIKKLVFGQKPSIGLVFLFEIGYIQVLSKEQYSIIDHSKKEERYLLCLLCHFYQSDLFGIPKKIKDYYQRLLTMSELDIEEDSKYYQFLHQLDSNILLEDVLSWLEVIGKRKEQKILQNKINHLGVDAPTPILKGNDFIELGIVPSKYLGILYEDCYQKQLSGYSKRELVQYIKEMKR